MQKMLTLYHKYSKADKYIIGFIYNDKVYYVIQDMIDEKNIRISKTSAGVRCLRLYINSANRTTLAHNAYYLCTTKHFNKVNTQINNFGFTFEKIVFSKFNRKWQKRDSTPFYKSGDILYKKVSYQIKFQGATLTNEDTLHKLVCGEIK